MKRIALLILPLLFIFFSILPVYAERGKKEIKQLSKVKGEIRKEGLNFYEYTASGRRDPFMPLIAKRDEIKPKKGALPLESFDVLEFKLIGILWNKVYYAVVTLPDGKSYNLREGMRIGLHGGKVNKITKDSVIIRENIKDYRGVLVPKDTILKLRKEEEG